jgi:endonuclease I
MKKMILLAVCSILLNGFGFSQGTETFTNIAAASSTYAAQNWTGDNGLAWSATDARTDQVVATANKAICIRVGAVSCSSIPNGIGSLTFKYKQVFGGTGASLEIRINGNLVQTITGLTQDVAQTATINTINITGAFNLEIKQTTATLRVAIDDIAWTGYSGLPCTAPTAQPTALTFLTITNTSIAGSFTAASPAANEYLIVRSNSSTLNTMPSNGTVYSSDDVIGNGIVVDRGNITSFTANSLSSGSTYYFFIFSISSTCTGGPLYLTTSPLTGNAATTAPPACSAPTGVAGTLNLTPASTSINGSFAAATGADGYLVIRSSSSTLGAAPVNGTPYTVGATFGSGVVVKFGSGTTFSSSGLTASTTYYFYVFAVSNFTCTGGPLYNTTSTNGNVATTSGGGGEPTGYYSSVGTSTCATLKTTLKTIITNGNSPNSYNDLWNQYLVSDIKPREVGSGSANTIWDIYSDNPTGTDPYNFIPGGSGTAGQCGNYSSEGDCYNREHSFPQNWFDGNTGSPGPATDYHHIFPTDGKVNGIRSNYIYGEVATPSITTQNGSKLGSSSFAGLTGPVFEPINTYKGDVARAFLYMVTRYENSMTTWGNLSGSTGLQALEPNTFPSVDIPYLKLMIKWHNQDPVSQKEIDRNNAAYAYQGNRNPFVDHPEYVDLVWNSSCPGLAALPVNIVYFSGKLQGDKVVLNWQVEKEINVDQYEVERSYNGVSYTKIGEVKAANLYNYIFNDNAEAIRGRTVYYRLKKADKDGSFSYSAVFKLHIPLNTKFIVYPNPSTGSFINVQLNNNLNDKVNIQVTDMTGRVLINQLFVANSGLISIPTSKLDSGSYLVKMLTGNNETFIQKVIVSK